MPAVPKENRIDAYRAPHLEPKGEQRSTLSWDDRGSRLCIAWPTVVVGTDDDFALDLVSTLLTGGRMSRLHRKLVLERGLATSVATHNDTRIDTGAFWLHAECAQGVAPTTLEAAIDAEIELLAREVPAAAEVARAKKMLAASEAHESETVSDLAEDLGEFAADARWQMALETIERIQAISAKAVSECTARLLRKERRVVGWCLPREKSAAPKARTTKRAARAPRSAARAPQSAALVSASAARAPKSAAPAKRSNARATASSRAMQKSSAPAAKTSPSGARASASRTRASASRTRASASRTRASASSTRASASSTRASARRRSAS